MMRRFRNRLEAGRLLGERLRQESLRRPVWVLAVPRGGVEVGYAIARALQAPMEVIIARKIGAPGNPELGIGAVSYGGTIVWNEPLVRALGLSEAQLRRLADDEYLELRRREHVYRRNRPMPSLKGTTVILTDDGLATGITARAAIEAIRAMNPAEIVLAVPVCAPESAEEIRPLVDRMICLLTPSPFYAVGMWYQEFPQLMDDEVLAYLEAAQDNINRQARE